MACSKFCDRGQGGRGHLSLVFLQSKLRQSHRCQRGELAESPSDFLGPARARPAGASEWPVIPCQRVGDWVWDWKLGLALNFAVLSSTLVDFTDTHCKLLCLFIITFFFFFSYVWSNWKAYCSYRVVANKALLYQATAAHAVEGSTRKIKETAERWSGFL